MKNMSIKIDAQTRDRLTDLAAQNNVSRGKLIRLLINNADPVSLQTISQNEAANKVQKNNQDDMSWALKKFTAYQLRQINHYQQIIDKNTKVMLNKPNIINQYSARLLRNVRFINAKIINLDKTISSKLKIRNKDKDDKIKEVRL